MEEGISHEALPRVFSEAIQVCWHLGIRYMWIDSLCIVQDSEEDWAKESNLMGKVYSHAIINIAATGAADSNGKLFNSAENSPSAGVISFGTSPENRYVVVENNIEWAKSFLNQPLLRRAWVVQERLLATRIVHFAQRELIWECRTIAATESYPVHVPEALRPFHDSRNRFWRTDFAEDDGAWSVLIQEYSKCELTFSKDRLVALSGLISALEERGLNRGCYFAGMWEADLPYCLLWTRAAVDQSRHPGARPDVYRAPSWSWASLEYPIWTEWASGTAESPLVSHWKVKEDNGPRAAAPLLSYSPLSIRLVGPLIQAKVEHKRPWVEAFGRGIERAQGISYCISHVDSEGTSTSFWDDEWNDVVFDDFDEANLEKTILCAPIYECEKWTVDKDDGMRLLGLLLEEVDGTTFRRIGAFSIGHGPDQVVLKRLPPSEYTII
ncbi:hypothetical protein N0V90_010775 [Kalmusia sp. IMI 367209]|nr:hypothetical protein N0V90_010775 [Kalmusia sp. IMI 367209]